MLYKLMPFYCESLSWLHLRCDGSCLLYKLCRVGILVWYIKFGITKIYSRTVSVMDDLYWSSLPNSLMDYCCITIRQFERCECIVLRA